VKQKRNPASKPNGTIEIFIPVVGSAGIPAADEKRAVQTFHSRLASPEFVKQMTGIFFDAKRAALASAK
jgi:hypothetical protein